METDSILWKEAEELIKEYNRLNLSDAIDYKKFFMYSIITHSTAIEGSTLTEAETQILFEDGLTAKGKPMIHHLMNEDLKNAYLFAVEQATKKPPITPVFLKELSSLVMERTGSVSNGISGLWDSSKGDYRLHGVMAGYGGKSYVNFNKVPELVDKLCHELNSKLNHVSELKDIYTLSFDAHLNLATIHPWGDGNGRISRLLMNYIQFWYNVIPSKIYKEDRADYIASLRESQDKSDPKSFQNFMLIQQIKMLKEEIANFKQSEKKGFSFMF
jgi:Fic family protein